MTLFWLILSFVVVGLVLAIFGSWIVFYVINLILDVVEAIIDKYYGK